MKAFTTIGTHHPWVLVSWTAPVPNFTSQCSWVEAGCAENKPSQIKPGNVIEKGCWWVVVTQEFQTAWPTQFLDPTLTATSTIYMYTSISINTSYTIFPKYLGVTPNFVTPPNLVWYGRSHFRHIPGRLCRNSQGCQSDIMLGYIHPRRLAFYPVYLKMWSLAFLAQGSARFSLW